uniref:PDZ domain-containing protein n=1 Tax=Zooxanthella nutricula TaxID=1333877 RepID=A0A6U6R0U7_9DINO|mmetsp:Transcript_69615/g.213443  ORF Transcript_69615/g.213443 Transcript_69615/m.213443 type:complete len:155 (+) Transcript_69615:110-574(+)
MGVDTSRCCGPSAYGPSACTRGEMDISEPCHACAMCPGMDTALPMATGELSATRRRVGLRPFQVFLTKTDERRTLGVDVDLSSGAEMVVRGVVPGLVADWNAKNPEFAIAADDRVIEVNGRRNPSDMAVCIVEESQLTITIRPGVSSRTPGVKV